MSTFDRMKFLLDEVDADLARALEERDTAQAEGRVLRTENEVQAQTLLEQTAKIIALTEARDALQQRLLLASDRIAELEGAVEFCRANHGQEQGPQLPLVKPLSALAVHSGYGVCQHVNFQATVYKHQAEVLERYGAMHIGEMRSLYNHKLSGFATAVAAARLAGVKWHATVATMDSTEAQVRDRIRHMAANTADLISAIEGVNEPNGDGFTLADAARAALIQWWIWDEVSRHPELAHVAVYSCSMHDVNLDNSDGRHWLLFADAEVRNSAGTVVLGRGRDFCHGGAVHGYQAGKPPGADAKLDERLTWCRDALRGGRNMRGELVKVTEMGWTNATAPKATRVGGAKVTSERASAAYDVQALFVYGRLGIPFLRYEFMDDPNGAKTQTEANFGLWEVETVEGDPDLTWTAKPVVEPLTAALGWLEDDGEPYAPTVVGVEVAVTAGASRVVDWVAVQKRDGSTRLYLWTADPIWDPTAEVDLADQLVEVTVTDAQGQQLVHVGATPVPVDLR